MASPAHAADDAVGLDFDLVILTRVGAALIGAMQQTGLGTAALEGHLEGLQGEMPVFDGTDRPANDEAREEVQDGGQTAGAAATGQS